MKYFAFLLLIFAFSLLIACQPAAAPISISNKPVSINEIPVTNQPLPPSKPVEEMTWAAIDAQTNQEGKVNKLKDFQGKAVILDFWATNCPPCIAEIPHLKELQAKYGKENLEVIGMHVGDEDDRRKLPAFAGRLQIDYTLAAPEKELIKFIFATRDDIPQTAVFDRQGKLINKFVGFDNEVKKDLDSIVEKAVSQN